MYRFKLLETIILSGSSEIKVLMDLESTQLAREIQTRTPAISHNFGDKLCSYNRLTSHEHSDSNYISLLLMQLHSKYVIAYTNFSTSDGSVFCYRIIVSISVF